jgi:hypothetical protein
MKRIFVCEAEAGGISLSKEVERGALPNLTQMAREIFFIIIAHDKWAIHESENSFCCTTHAIRIAFGWALFQ